MYEAAVKLLWFLLAVFIIATGALASEGSGEEIQKLKQLPIAELEKAANAGNPNAQVLLGYAYFTGDRLERDYQKALAYYQDAAKNGEHMAMSNICNMYLYGYGVEKDYMIAFQWCTEPARAGNANAMVMIAEIFSATDGLLADMSASFRNEAAFKFYEMAATRGHKGGQYMLGWFYENGLGVEKNTALAATWYDKSAEQGYERAINAAQQLKIRGASISK